jgi:type I restriction-modification system DNA methylase subunit
MLTETADSAVAYLADTLAAEAHIGGNLGHRQGVAVQAVVGGHHLVLAAFETVDGLATVVTNETIQDKDNSLSVNQYVAGSDDDGEAVDMDALLSGWERAATRAHKALDAFGNLV